MFIHNYGTEKIWVLVFSALFGDLRGRWFASQSSREYENLSTLPNAYFCSQQSLRTVTTINKQINTFLSLRTVTTHAAVPLVFLASAVRL